MKAKGFSAGHGGWKPCWRAETPRLEGPSSGGVHVQKENWEEVPRTWIAQGQPPPAQTHRPTQLAVVLPLGDGVEGLTAAPATLFFLVTLRLRGPSPGLKL